MSKWKDRKSKARANATQKKLSRGRQSGATNKETKHQRMLIDIGYEKYEELLVYLIK